MFAYLASAILAYLIGSFPSGFLAGRICGVDLRVAGSGNVGATNALRVLGKKWGYTVFASDAFKGALAVLTGAGYSAELADGQLIEIKADAAICRPSA